MQPDDSSHREHDSPPERVGSENPEPRPLPNFEEATVISDQSPLPVQGDSNVDYSMANLSPADLGRVLLGQRVAHYELREFVGGGGMGAVFRAHDTQLDRTVALKILSRGHGTDGEMLRRFRNEAQSAARLDHEYIARVYFFGEDRGLHYIVFEFIEGTNVRDMIARTGPLNIEQSLSYTIQVAEALNHAHGRSVVHRDIKPSNIIVTSEGRAKLVDMGLARLHQVQRPDDDLTASGVTLGTFDYISPEQARDPRNADVRSDIYSLGCTLYYMLTGRPPFPEGTVLQKLLQHQGDEAPDPREWNAEIPDELWTVMRRMLAKDPKRRYQSPSSLLIDLSPLANQYGIQISGGSGVPWQQVEPPAPTFLDRHIAWMLPVALLLIAAGAARFAPLRAVELPPTRRTILNESSLSAGTITNRQARAGADSQRQAPTEKPTPPASASGTVLPPEFELDGFKETQPTEPPKAGVPPLSSNRAASGVDLPADLGVALENMDRLEETNDPVKPGNREGDARIENPSPDKSATTLGNEAAANAPAELKAAPVPLLPSESDESVEPPEDRSFEEPPRETGDAGSNEPEIRIVDRRSQASTASIDSPVQPGLLIVNPTASGRGVYGSLSEACHAAGSGDVIELRFTGTTIIQPILLREINLTIRAGTGFQPVVSYEPAPPRGAAPRRSMFTLSGGRLTIVGVGLNLKLPADVPSDSWSLLRVAGAEAVHIERCTLTVTQLLDDPATQAAFFRLEETPILFRGGSPTTSEIELQDCIARGEADLLRIKGAVSVSLKWSNGLFASSRRLLSAVGAGSQLDDEPAEIKIELNHVTAAMREGLCLLYNSPDAVQQAPTKIRVANCILVVDAESPLIEQRGALRAADLQKQLQWQGDRNFYEGFNTFWEIYGLDQDAEPQKMTLQTWQSFWGGGEDNLPKYRRVAWRAFPPISRPRHTHVPEDYALNDDPSRENAARNAASDGFDVGFRADRLPEVPTDVRGNLDNLHRFER